MKKLFYFLAIILIVSFLGGCKKDPLDAIPADQARMYGKVVEKGTKKPVKGVKVYLRNCTCVIGGCSCSTIDSLTTDDMGRYDFTYKFNGFKGRSFDIVVRVPSGFLPENSPIALAPTTHDNVNYDIEIQPLAWIKIHVKNVTPFDEFDKIWISGGWSGAAGDHQYYGKNPNFYIKKEIIGNDSIGVGWYVTKNQKEIFSKVKLYAIAHDTIKFEIFY